MDKLIEVKVNGSYITKDSNVAGVQGEANATTLRIEFDPSWDGLVKKVIFWDVFGQNPVERTLTVDLLENINNTRIYRCPIPGEPLVHPGKCSFSIEGYADGKRQRSLEDRLLVKESGVADHTGQPVDPSPTQAEQIQGQIQNLMGELQVAVNAKEAAQASAEAAAQSAEDAYDSERFAQGYLQDAKNAMERAESAGNKASTARADAQAAAAAAAESAASIAGSVTAAQEAATQAAQSAGEAEASAAGAGTDAAAAKASAEAAASSEAFANSYLEDAKTNAGWAIAAADEATAAMRAAEDSEAQAKAAQAAAEKARDEAGVIVGGDFATRTEAQDMADAAKDAANTYTDEKIAAIPAPDVSGQIGAHNTDDGAHEDIRAQAAEKVSKAGDTMTGDLTLQPEGVGGYSRVKKNATTEGDWGLQLQDNGDDGSFMGLTICAKNQKLEFKKKAAGATEYSYPRIYDSDNPPQPDEVNALPIWGGTMEGALTLSGDPYQAKHAATKQYVDAVGNRVGNMEDKVEEVEQTAKDALAAAGKGKKIASYETAGSYQWTAPDLADGKAYKIGVLIIGAGGSGCADKTGTGSSQYNHCSGGASGYSRAIAKEVSPGEVITLVVGKGGARVSDSTDRTVGKTGGTSSFDGVTALGGEGGDPVQDSGSTAVSVTQGACPGRSTHGGKRDGFFGMDRSDIDPYYDSYLGIPAQCFNPFEQKEILASGGGAYTAKTSSGSAGKGGKNPLTGKGGGDGAYNISGNATATAATEPGCGGGSASASGTATSGAGADGAVYIYFLGVADE